MTAYIIEPDPYKAFAIEQGLAIIGIQVKTYADRFSAMRAIKCSKQDPAQFKNMHFKAVLKGAKSMSAFMNIDDTSNLRIAV